MPVLFLIMVLMTTKVENQMKRNTTRALLWSVILGGLFLLTHYLHTVVISLDKSDKPESYQATVLPKADTLRFVSFGYDKFLADIYWLAFIQYLGDTPERMKDRYQACADYLNLITELDPHFTQAYWFAAFSVGADQRRPDIAAKIIQRGINANQDNWYLPFIAGINQYLYANNEAAAARYYRMAARFPDAPEWLLRQAQILEAKLPRLFKEIRTWDTIYESNPNGLVKQTARNKLIGLWQYVYEHTPSEHSKKAAAKELQKLGVQAR